MMFPMFGWAIVWKVLRLSAPNLPQDPGFHHAVRSSSGGREGIFAAPCMDGGLCEALRSGEVRWRRWPGFLADVAHLSPTYLAVSCSINKNWVINDAIQTDKVRLVIKDEATGKNSTSIVTRDEALAKAKSMKLDLVLGERAPLQLSMMSPVGVDRIHAECTLWWSSWQSRTLRSLGYASCSTSSARCTSRRRRSGGSSEQRRPPKS